MSFLSDIELRTHAIKHQTQHAYPGRASSENMGKRGIIFLALFRCLRKRAKTPNSRVICTYSVRPLHHTSPSGYIRRTPRTRDRACCKLWGYGVPQEEQPGFPTQPTLSPHGRIAVLLIEWNPQGKTLTFTTREEVLENHLKGLLAARGHP